VIARRQQGVVSRTQLRAAGIGADAIDLRLRQRRLHPIHRGVYLVGHPIPAPLARETAAILACGPTAVLSHRTAARLWGIAPFPSTPIEVTTTSQRRHHAGITVHRTQLLQAPELRHRHGLPLTSAARALLDLATVVDDRILERAFHEARARRLVTSKALAALLDHHRRRPGAGILRRLVDADSGPTLTRSEAEERALALIRRAQLPAPRVNARLGRFEVDLLWPAQRLVVEVDGFAYHSDPASFERDRRRDGELAAAGYTVIRVTWHQITGRPEATVAILARALARAAPEAA